MDQVILITGCSTGFGYVSAKALAEKGHTVYASMRDIKGKNSQPANELDKWASEEGLNLSSIELDVTDEHSINNAIQVILTKESRIDVLVNNAGWGSVGFVETYSTRQAKQQFEVNVFGLFNVTKAVLPSMRKNKAGLIINISSIVGRAVFPMFSLYSGSKHAIEGMSQSWKYELAPIGVDSVIVEPGIYPTTNFYESLAANSPEPDDQINTDYGELANLPKSFGENVLQMVESGNYNDPHLVAHAIIRLIETPFGERPIRVVADPMTENLYKPYNEHAETLQNSFLEMFLGS